MDAVATSSESRLARMSDPAFLYVVVTEHWRVAKNTIDHFDSFVCGIGNKVVFFFLVRRSDFFVAEKA